MDDQTIKQQPPLIPHFDLHDAVRSVSFPVVYHALATGADVNAAHPETGFTPLMLAVIALEEEMVLLLLAHGADPNLCGPDARSPAQQLLDTLREGGSAYDASDIYSIAALLTAAGATDEQIAALNSPPWLLRAWCKLNEMKTVSAYR